MVSEDPNTNSNKYLKLDIVTPERLIYSDYVNSVTAPGEEGELGILPRHCPLITTLHPGALRILKDEEEIDVVIGGGFLEVRSNRIVILADIAERNEEINIQHAEEAKRRVEKILSSGQASAIDKEQAEAALRLELGRLKVARKQKHKKKKIA